MYSPDDIQYALETTNVLYEPDRRIDTFGTTRFEFQLLSELMDSVGRVRIRSGEVEAHRPTIIRPEEYPNKSSSRALVTTPDGYMSGWSSRGRTWP